jgi:acetyl esterase
MSQPVLTTLEAAPLDPALAGFLAQAAAQNNPPLETLPPAVARQIYRDLDIALAAPAPGIGAVKDLSIDGPAGPLALRVYQPAQRGVYPVLLYVHGGGFVIGDLQSHDTVCRTLCHLAQRVVVAVDYRLAPEHPFPAAPDDVEATLRWVCSHAESLGGEANNIAIAGDSAGAQLALVAARRVASAQVTGVGLIYPVAQHPDTPSPSYIENGSGKFLDMGVMHWFMTCYLGQGTVATRHPDVALLTSEMKGLPATWVATMGHDPLRDEGHALALRMEQSGTAVTHQHFASGIHACIHFTAVSPIGLHVLSGLAQWLRLRVAASS